MFVIFQFNKTNYALATPQSEQFVLSSVLDDIRTPSILEIIENAMMSSKTGTILLQNFLITIKQICTILIQRKSECAMEVFESVLRSFPIWDYDSWVNFFHGELILLLAQLPYILQTHASSLSTIRLFIKLSQINSTVLNLVINENPTIYELLQADIPYFPETLEMAEVLFQFVVVKNFDEPIILNVRAFSLLLRFLAGKDFEEEYFQKILFLGSETNVHQFNRINMSNFLLKKNF